MIQTFVFLFIIIFAAIYSIIGIINMFKKDLKLSKLDIFIIVFIMSILVYILFLL